MKYQEHQQALLVLEDGKTFRGHQIGVRGTAFGEICFNTGMTGYQETFTDPSYYGQLITMSTPHIGNYGVIPADSESNTVTISGLICNEFSGEYFSRPQANKGVLEYFQEHNIVGIQHIDTRELVRYIRSKGAMNAVISSEEATAEVLLNRIKKEAPLMEGLALSSKVSTENPYFYGDSKSTLKIAVLDLGVKENILKCLTSRGAYLKVFPWNTTKEELLAWDPDGIMLSNGPGDPSAMEETIKMVKQLVEINKPLFGICLGHQILALSQGLSTYKMHNGHRGINHPVKNLQTGLCEITSQNHGFVVSKEEVDVNKNIELTHIHLNDQTVAGISVKGKNAFSVQFHPESSAGPNDSRYLFDNFISLITQYKTTI